MAMNAMPAAADVLVAAHTIHAQAIIGPDDVTVTDGNPNGGLGRAEDAIGQETRVAIYQGRPILSRDIGPPSVIERNQAITIVFRSSGLSISAEGRALERGGSGDRIRAMNMASHTTVVGTIETDGTLSVSPSN